MNYFFSYRTPQVFLMTKHVLIVCACLLLIGMGQIFAQSSDSPPTSERRSARADRRSVSRTLCTDRGESYDAKELNDVDQQKCLSHMLRSIDGMLETTSGQARFFGVVLKTQLQEAIALYKSFHDPESKLRNYAACVRALELEVSWHLRPRQLRDRDNQRLLNEIGRHHERGNLLRFLHSPTTVEPTNNAAERALRPAVVARKVSQCSKNERGAAA